MEKNEILKRLEERRRGLKARGIKRIGLFGSYLKGNQKKGSDIDLLVAVDKDSEENYFEILFYLESFLKKKVDLIIESDLRKELKNVKKEAQYVKL